jgi:hypothetical protein
MFRMTFALCLPLALSAFAQEKSPSNEAPAKPAESSAATGAAIEEARAKAEAERAKLPVLQLNQLNFQDTLKKLTEKSTGLCSIPLLEVPVVPGAHTLKQVTPDLNKLAPMPQGKGPAPPCAATPR